MNNSTCCKSFLFLVELYLSINEPIPELLYSITFTTLLYTNTTAILTS